MFEAIVTGIISGIIAGIIVAIVQFFLIRWLTSWWNDYSLNKWLNRWLDIIRERTPICPSCKMDGGYDFHFKKKYITCAYCGYILSEPKNSK